MMRTRTLGWTGETVGVIGFGTGELFTQPIPENEQTALLDSAIAAGVTLLDTADTYCLSPDDLHHSERALASVAASHPHVRIATKGGTIRTTTGWRLDGHPDRLYQSIVESHAALGSREPIFLWQHHWPDPRWTIRQMLEPVQHAVDEGIIRYVGVGNYTLDQLKQACDLLPIATIQNQFNLWHRDAETNGLFDFCEERQLVFLPYRPLGGGELARRLGEIPTVARLALDRGISPQRLIIAWLLAKSPCLLPIPGTKQLAHLRDILQAADLKLDDEERQQLDAIRPEQLPTLDRDAKWSAHPPLSDRPTVE